MVTIREIGMHELNSTKNMRKFMMKVLPLPYPDGQIK